MLLEAERRDDPPLERPGELAPPLVEGDEGGRQDEFLGDDLVHEDLELFGALRELRQRLLVGRPVLADVPDEGGVLPGLGLELLPFEACGSGQLGEVPLLALQGRLGRPQRVERGRVAGRRPRPGCGRGASGACSRRRRSRSPAPAAGTGRSRGGRTCKG